MRGGSPEHPASGIQMDFMQTRNLSTASLSSSDESPFVSPARNENQPVTPLPNPGEGSPVYPDSSENQPVIPLPNPGEGGPVHPGSSNNRPVFPLPLPGTGGVVIPGGVTLPIWPKFSRARFLNAAYGYRPFRILVNNARTVNWLSYAALSGYGKIPSGYQTVTVTGPNGYVYIQKSLPFLPNQNSTIAIINTPSGLDLLQIPDNCCTPNGSYSNFRVSNLALNTRPLDVLLGDGRVVYADVRYKETTAYKRIHPGTYQFFFAETDLTPMPKWMDIETLDSAFIGTYPVPNTVASLYLNAVNSANYTVFLLPSGPDSIQAMLAETR